MSPGKWSLTFDNIYNDFTTTNEDKFCFFSYWFLLLIQYFVYVACTSEYNIQQNFQIQAIMSFIHISYQIARSTDTKLKTQNP